MLGIGLGITSRLRSSVFNPASLFRNGEQGWFYDLSDMSTLFQDAAGTTPVTAVGQPVGLQLDKSRGLVRGPELVTNGDFSNGATGWTVETGITIAGGVANFNTTTNNFIIQNISVTPNTFYEVTLNVVSYVRGSPFVLLGASGIVTIPSPSVLGQKKIRVFSAAGTSDFRIGGIFGAGWQGSIDNISVRELPGNHSSQSTPSFRGVLQGSPSRLVLDGSDDRYVTTLNPTASGTIAARIRGATASRVVAGSQGATDGRALLALAADGSIAAGVGAQSTAVIKGTVDKRNVWVTACVTWNGTTVRLYEDGVEVYSGAQSGAVNTTVPFIYGALNANGTASAFWDDDIGASLVISRAITATEAVQLHNAWRNIA